MDLFLKISVLQTTFCWLGDFENTDMFFEWKSCWEIAAMCSPVISLAGCRCTLLAGNSSISLEERARKWCMIRTWIRARQWFKFSFSELGCSLLEFNLRKIRQHLTNRTFYQYGGHIEFTRFKGYYGMPGGPEADRLLGMPKGHSLSIYALFSGEKRISLYISREKGDHCYIQTRHNDPFALYNLFSRGTL